MLEHDEVALAGSVGHEGLELGAEGVEEVVGTGDEGLGGEDADPLQAGDDAVGFGLRGELADLLDSLNEGAMNKSRSDEGHMKIEVKLTSRLRWQLQ